MIGRNGKNVTEEVKNLVNKLRSFIESFGLLLLRNFSRTKCSRDSLAKSLDSTTPLIFFAGEKCNESYAF